MSLDLSPGRREGHIIESLINAGESSVSSNDELTGTHLVLRFDYLARKLEGTLTGQAFTGMFGNRNGRSFI